MTGEMVRAQPVAYEQICRRLVALQRACLVTKDATRTKAHTKAFYERSGYAQAVAAFGGSREIDVLELVERNVSLDGPIDNCARRIAHGLGWMWSR